MATTKKQVSNAKKPKKNVTAKEEVKNTAAASEVIETEENHVEEKPRTIISRRVWPD